MADNTQLNSGSGGDIISTDDLGSVKVQRVKVQYGVDGSATDVSDSNPLPIDDAGGSITVDGTVTVVGSAAEDAAASGNPVLVGGRYDSSARTLETGDVGALAVNASGQLLVEIAAGAGSGGTSAADGATFTRNTTSITPVGAVVESSAPTLTNGDVAGLSQTTAGALRVAVTSGGIAGVVEDAASAGGEEGLLILGVRRDTAASSSGTDGDFSTFNLDANGRLHVAVGALPASTNTIEVVGDVALDAAVAGNPLLIGGRGSTAAPTAVSADGDAVYQWLTRTGATVVSGETVDDSAFTAGTNRVVAAGFFADETSTDSVDENDIGAARMTLDRKQIVVPYAHAAGGATPGRILSAASTNGTVVKASAGTLYSLIVTNTNAAARYLKVYNSTSVTVGTTTPAWTIAIPGNTAGAGFAVPIPACGIAFGTGICLGLTTGAADNDTAAVAANEICVAYSYV